MSVCWENSVGRLILKSHIETYWGLKTENFDVYQTWHHVKALNETSRTVGVRAVSDVCMLRKFSWEVNTEISHWDPLRVENWKFWCVSNLISCESSQRDESNGLKENITEMFLIKCHGNRFWGWGIGTRDLSTSMLHHPAYTFVLTKRREASGLP